MPPRSYYVQPRENDYLAFATAFFPDELPAAVEFTTRTGLPYINSPEHIASYLGVEPSLVRQILHRPSYHYRNFKIKKIDGTDREIFTPRTYLKVIQWWILDNILRKGNVHPANHGFVIDRSYVTNARMHVGCKHLLNLDIKQFFPSINFEKIKQVFQTLGYEEAGANSLAQLTSLAGCAPTGAPTSPMIGNLILYTFDVELTEKCAQIGCLYTRYADDITISSQDMIGDETRILVEQLVENNGFQTNGKKTKFMGRGNRMEVTGLTINDGVNLSAEWRNAARGFFHSVLKSPGDFEDEKSNISGLYGTLLALDPEKSKKLTKAAEQALLKVKALEADPDAS